MNDGGNSLGGMSRKGSSKDDQTESETDNWKDFVSENEDDYKHEDYVDRRECHDYTDKGKTVGV